MLKNLPSLKAKQLVRLLKSGGCKFYREGKGDHKLYVRYVEGKKRVAPFYGTTARGSGLCRLIKLCKVGIKKWEMSRLL